MEETEREFIAFLVVNNAQWATMCQFGKNEFYNWENAGDSFKTTVMLQSLRKCISFFIWSFELIDICI